MSLRRRSSAHGADNGGYDGQGGGLGADGGGGGGGGGSGISSGGIAVIVHGVTDCSGADDGGGLEDVDSGRACDARVSCILEAAGPNS